MTILSRITSRLFSDEIKNQVRLQLSEIDSFMIDARSLSAHPRDRQPNEYLDILEQSLEAWRTNPLARRIVGLTTQYVVGKGIEFSCVHEYTAKFIKRFYNHPSNKLMLRAHEWCDELTRTGNLFLLMSTDPAGMSYFRAFPATQVDKIVSADNDVEQELQITLKSTLEKDAKIYPVYDPNNDSLDTDGHPAPVFFHYSINRAVGSQFGDSDLAPILKWLSRYSNWLEDRARLNRFRTAFLYVVTGKFANNAERLKRQAELTANPPNPGSILVTDESEKWEVLSSKLESADANADGLALKKMIASGVGIPLHFLAEPESSTKTTAEAAGGPTYRHFEERQEFFENLLHDLLVAVVTRGSMFDKQISTESEITVQGADISSRDNVSLAMAATNIFGVLKDLRDRKLIDDQELIRLLYRFVGETVDIEEMLARGKKAPDPTLTGESVIAATEPASPKEPNSAKGPKHPAPPARPGHGDATPKQEIKIDPSTGEEITPGES